MRFSSESQNKNYLLVGCEADVKMEIFETSFDEVRKLD